MHHLNIKKVLGISDTHNAAAALLLDGEYLRALQEERSKRVKNYSGFPDASISWLLKHNDLQSSDVDIVGLAGHHQPPDRNRDELIAVYRNIHSFASTMKRVLRKTPIFSMQQVMRKKQRIDRLLRIGFKREQLRFYDHHRCHAATAYYGWGKYDEPVLILSSDGAGDGLCATVSIGDAGNINRLYSLDWSHSIGILYSVVTYMMGMAPLEHEYKMMGMAPYAKSTDAARIAAKLSGLFEWDDDEPLWKKKADTAHIWYIKQRLEKLFFEERFDTVMSGVQLFTEQMMCEFARRAIAKTGIHKLALSGGVFMNVKANKAIMALEDVEDLFVFPSCGDEANAIGACYLAQAEQGSLPKPITDIYLGPCYSNENISHAIDQAQQHGMKLDVSRSDDINLDVAKLLASGEIIARFHGREEFGARSLGNRAIIADPRQPGVVKSINEMIKNRDFWMPFAASILDEYVEQYLINPKNIDAPYMILSFDSTEEGQKQMKAGIHPYDGTCRPQVVTEKSNAEYWDLIKKFSQITGVGGLLNTSLNLHGSPLVHEPKDALYVLEKSGLRYLVMGPFLIKKHHKAS